MRILSNKAYDILKWISMVFLGAFGEFYNQMSDVWGLPYGEGVATTCFRLATFLGICLGISTIQYKQNQAKLDHDSYEEFLQRMAEEREAYKDTIQEMDDMNDEEEDVND